MLICLDCKSTNIAEVNQYQTYFREGDYVRLRTIFVHENMNENLPKGFMSFCPELSISATAIGDTELQSITKLGEILEAIYHVKLLGKTIEG